MDGGNEATGGLEMGAPSLETAKKGPPKMIREGKAQQANCLGAVVAHTV